VSTKPCARCKRVFPLEDFWQSPTTGRYHSYCPSCKKEWDRENYYQHRDERREKERLYAAANKDKIRVYQRQRGIERREAGHNRTEEARARRRDYHASVKGQVLGHYSGGTPTCDCCGETNITFLTLDHKEKGSEHRRSLAGRSGQKHMYLWAKQNSYPPMFDVKCFNCNTGRHINGGICPHETERLRLVA
jgi:hypothetical protein